jgi:hypothetical protein
MDKSSLNYANAYGLQTDLHLVGRDYCKLIYLHVVLPNTE